MDVSVRGVRNRYLVRSSVKRGVQRFCLLLGRCFSLGQAEEARQPCRIVSLSRRGSACHSVVGTISPTGQVRGNFGTKFDEKYYSPTMSNSGGENQSISSDLASP